MRHVALVPCVLLLIGCSQQQILEKFSSPEDQAAAKAYIALLRARDFDAIEKAMDPSIQNPTFHQTLERMAAIIPPGEPQSVTVVGAQVYKHTDSGARTVNTTFEFDFGGKWLLINVALKSKGGESTIVGFNVYPEAQSLAERNRFRLTGKGTAQYAVLGAALAAILLSIYALVRCIRMKLSGRKWPWIVFILFGVGKVIVNWTTGQLSVMPLSVQLLSASAVAPFNGAWMISASVPLGAIVFLVRRKRLAASVVSEPALPSSPS